MKKWGITGVTVLTPDEVMNGAGILINSEKLEKVTGGDIKAPVMVDIEDGVLTPGLINGHDHFLGNYFPKVGNGPYENWLPWDNDLKSAPVYRERQQIENRDLYLLAAYRNLVSGVTTASDHIPHFVHEPFLDILPMKVIKDFTMEHSIASFALAWGKGVEVEYKMAIEKDIPFVTHISEGFDPETRNDIKTLDRKGGLGDHSVLVHGLSFSDDDIKLIKNKGASVVWCADSNLFMYNKTTNIKKLLDTGVNVCIGTDSPMSGGENILYEFKIEKNFYKKEYHEELKDEQLVKMATINAAHAFKLKKNGQIKNGYLADFTIFSKKDKNPYSSVVSANLRDVMMVVINGRPVYGNARFADLFDSLGVKYQKILMEDTEKIITGDLIGLLKRISRAVGFKKEFPFMPVEFDV
jgi:5-methylthioadenosine/S-adenosylhomocysteine deaminase